MSMACDLGDNRNMKNQTTMAQTILTERQKKYQKRRINFEKNYVYVKGFVDNRPVMPDTLCLKLVQSLIDDEVSKEAHIGVIDSTPILMLFLHEAGFTNLTLLNTKPVKALREKDRDWLSAIKSLCENNKIRVVDFMSKTHRFDIVIGNPPYGNNAKLAVDFLNQAFDLTGDVRYVLPRSFRKVSVTNRVRLDAVCVYDETLPRETFLPETSNTKACYQRWISGSREKVKTLTTHPDFEFVTYGQADLMIRRIGSLAGKVMPEFRQWGCSASGNYFVKVSDPSVIYKLQSIQSELIEVGLNANNQESVSKHEIISTYQKYFG